MANSNQYEAEVRRKFGDAFDDAMRYVTDDALKDPLIGGMMIQVAIGTTSDSFKNYFIDRILLYYFSYFLDFSLVLYISLGVRLSNDS